MTCFWDGILKKLNNQDFNIMFQENRRYNMIEFIETLKKKNKIVENVKWNNINLTKKEKKEIFKIIKNYDINKISKGHLHSTCEYFLIFICYLCEVNIIHRFNRVTIRYINTKNARKTLIFTSNKRYFW